MKAGELAAHRQAVGADAVSAIPDTLFRPVGLDRVVEALAGVAAGAPLVG